MFPFKRARSHGETCNNAILNFEQFKVPEDLALLFTHN